MRTVQNIPDYASNYNYIVAREINQSGKRELWFWGAWNDRDTANEVAIELENGIVFKSEDVIPKPLTKEEHEEIKMLADWLTTFESIDYHMLAIEKELMDYELRFKEAMAL